MVGPIWMNFQGLVDWSWLTYGWVLPVPSPHWLLRTWLAPSPFPWKLSHLLLLALPGCVIPFWKAFDEQNKNVGAEFLMLRQKPRLRVIVDF